jgi:hypothetical protein
MVLISAEPEFLSYMIRSSAFGDAAPLGHAGAGRCAVNKVPTCRLVIVAPAKAGVQ